MTEAATLLAALTSRCRRLGLEAAEDAEHTEAVSHLCCLSILCFLLKFSSAFASLSEAFRFLDPWNEICSYIYIQTVIFILSAYSGKAMRDAVP